MASGHSRTREASVPVVSAATRKTAPCPAATTTELVTTTGHARGSSRAFRTSPRTVRRMRARREAPRCGSARRTRAAPSAVTTAAGASHAITPCTGESRRSRAVRASPTNTT